MTDQHQVVVFDRVTKKFDTAAGGHLALGETSFELPMGRVVSIVGRSGSGKSTLLHLSAGIDLPTSGRVSLLGVDLATLPDRQRTLQRRQHVGLVFQFFHLLSHLSVIENVLLPSFIAADSKETRGRGMQLLSRVGLVDRADDPAGNLSGGEMQRVALCRALLRDPTLILADEPTGNLDDTTALEVMDLLLEISREQGRTLLYVTHDTELAARADEQWEIHSGVLKR